MPALSLAEPARHQRLQHAPKERQVKSVIDQMMKMKFKNRDIPLVDLVCCSFEQGICGIRYHNGDIAYFVGLWRRFR